MSKLENMTFLDKETAPKSIPPRRKHQYKTQSPISLEQKLKKMNQSTSCEKIRRGT
jgi:hypothetical protein